MLRQVNPYMSEYKIPREILDHMEDILDKKNLGEKGYIAVILNPIRDDNVDILDELNLDTNEIEVPDNNFFYIVIKGKKHPMKKDKRYTNGVFTVSVYQRIVGGLSERKYQCRKYYGAYDWRIFYRKNYRSTSGSVLWKRTRLSWK